MNFVDFIASFYADTILVDCGQGTNLKSAAVEKNEGLELYEVCPICGDNVNADEPICENCNSQILPLNFSRSMQ